MRLLVTLMADANCTAGRQVPVTSSHGFLASVVTEQTRLGSADCPWLISAETGQTISVYLHDFSIWRHNASASHQQTDVAVSICQVTACQITPF